MISGTSFSKWIAFKSAIKRFKWLSVLYGVILFLELPLIIWMQLSKQKALQGDWVAAANTNLPQIMFNPVWHFVNFLVSIVFGLILFNYLQKDRASSFFHSLPIKRVSLYCQNLFAGLTLIWLPILINGLLAYGIFSLFGVTEGEWTNMYKYNQGIEMLNNAPDIFPMWQIIGYWLLLNFLMTGLFYIFTVFVGMLTGNVLLQGALTFIGVLLPLGLYILITQNLAKLLYGFSANINNRNLEWLSPFVSYLNEQNYRQVLYFGSSFYLWYFITALILCGLSIFLYKIRNTEAAGETLAAEWIRQIFKYGVAICAAMTGALYLSSLYENSIGVLYLGYFIGAVLGYIIADMIAYKSVHFYKRWKGMLIFGSFFILLLTTINSDFYGYERYVPAQEEVKEVLLSSLSREGLPQGLTGEDNISRVRQLHQQIINLEKENSALQISTYNKPNSIARPMDPLVMINSMEITYVLEGGRKLRRNYSIDIYRYSEFLKPIFNTEEAKKTMFGRLFKMDGNKIDQININNYRFNKNVRIYKRGEIQEALAALRKDILSISYEAAMEGKVPSRAGIEFVSKNGRQDQSFISSNLDYFTEFENFAAFLEKYGYTDDLIFDPEDVSTIIVKQVGSDKTVNITDKVKIKLLLDWCNIEDERAYIMRQQPMANKQMQSNEYYGKVVKKKGSSLYVVFNSSPYGQQLIYKMLNNK